MRIVVDTNVLVSAVLSQQGPSHALWDHVLNARVELFVTQALLDEFAEVISRDKFAAVLARTTRTSQALLLKLREAAELVASVPLPAPVSRDPDDDHAIAAAGKPDKSGALAKLPQQDLNWFAPRYRAYLIASLAPAAAIWPTPSVACIPRAAASARARCGKCSPMLKFQDGMQECRPFHCARCASGTAARCSRRSCRGSMARRPHAGSAGSW